MSKHTPGPWFVSGVRFRMNGGEWHSINRYNEELKRDENIACVGYDPRTGDGMADARLIAAAPDMLAALKAERQADLAEERHEAMIASPDYDDDAVVDDMGVFVLELRGTAKELRDAAIAKAEGRS